MFVCGFWVVMIALNQYFDGRNKARMMLMLFMAVATLLYAGHCVFLNRFYSNMPLTTVFTPFPILPPIRCSTFTSTV